MKCHNLNNNRKVKKNSNDNINNLKDIYKLYNIIISNTCKQ